MYDPLATLQVAEQRTAELRREAARQALVRVVACCRESTLRLRARAAAGRLARLRPARRAACCG